MKRIMKYALCAASLGLIAAGMAAGRAYADEKQSDQILDNVYIGDISVGGMNRQEAEQAVSDYVEDLKNTTLTLTVNKKKITATAGQLGIQWKNTGIVDEALQIGKSGSLITRYKDKKDLEHEPRSLDLAFEADKDQIKKYLKKNEGKVNQKAVNGGLKRENGAFTVTDGKEGIAVNIPESTEAIAEYIASKWDGKEASVELTAKVVQPRGSREELSKVKDVLGTFSTDYSGSTAGRATNVNNGCNRINGTVVYPGDVFSVYEMVSPFDAEHGYELAGSYENGMVVDTYGGGICQVSTTLYNAAILAELEIRERYAHSMIVTYVQPSMDAAIAGTVKDLKFENTTDAPVYIEGIASGGILTFTIYGQETRKPGREVIFESEVISETRAPDNVQASESYDVGYVAVQNSTHPGKTARLWKVVKVNGEEQSREEFNYSAYAATPRTIIVGTRTSSPEARAVIQSAIASGDENTIRAAAANAAAIAARPQEPEEPENPDEGEDPTDESKPAEGDKPDKPDKPSEGNGSEGNSSSGNGSAGNEKPKDEKPQQDEQPKKQQMNSFLPDTDTGKKKSG